MLDSLRKKQKVIVYIVAVTFILSLAGVGGVAGYNMIFSKNYLGKVNSSKITSEMYYEKMREIRSRYEAQGQQINEQMMSQIEQSAWDELVSDLLLKQQIKKNHIRVSEAEIRKAMENESDIPDQLKQDQNLQTNGKFDINKYYNGLNNSPQFSYQIYQYMKEYLPRKKLQDKIVKKSGINADSLKAEFVKEMDSMTGKAIWFDFNQSEAVTVSDAEVKKYYEKNKDKEFKKGPATKLKYVTIEFKPSDADFAEKKITIDKLYTQIMSNPAEFGNIAKANSDDPGSAAQFGSLGSFGRGQMVPEFDTVAFSLNVGQISKPFRTQFGWHIVRCDSIQVATPGEEKIVASHILSMVKITDATKSRVKKQADAAKKLIEKKGIDKAAKELKLEITTSEWLSHDNESMPGFGNNSTLFQFMKKSKAGKVSEVTRLGSGDQTKLIVAQVAENKKTYYEDFASKKLQIKFDLEKQKKVANVKAKAEEFAKRVAKEDYLKTAEAEGWKIIDLNGHKQKGYIPTVNASLEDFSKAALALNSGQYSQLITTKEGPFIIYCDKRDKADIKKMDKAKQEEIRKRMEDAAFNRWWQQIRKDAKIIDNRYDYGY